ncbi:urea ABC transporter ATP-binding subunit UrtE [Betaproteobacteria bacterium SCN1]|jgi:urea transport system ATP-binding protein|nr:urea ABC transporter ATP-binding subunit UrtE [Betaproteobacteria bacterium SCN1]MBN8759337.1 urea ABC transporter ATP-binding subunit UrtE [Thiobacillus sp.]ODU90279.1 MAG: urea ABC transporter ATP-binding subunit UrtE [Thiobacillus sp. SCN 65-179]OJW34785.1 MAG: urea ABC transporter ATP-binding subunit UrtE [Thiobacillus sp. 65-69]
MLKAETLDQYYGGSQILRGVSLDVPPGKVTVLLGRNGVGKTTLLKCLMGALPVKAGRMSLSGEDVTRLKPHQRARRGLGYVPQGRDIFGRLTVRENLLMGLAANPKAKTVPDDIFELFPVLKTMLHRRGGDLSGGQQQQLAIGRALAAGPKYLILDEPTEGIQPSIIKDIGRVITLLAERGMGILLVEQYYDFAEELADFYAVMQRGEIIRSGTGETLPTDGVRQMVAI